MRKAITAAALTAFAAFAPAFAFAQQEADAITVTATRFSEDARRLPASTTVLTEEDIRKSAARTLPELLQEQTGITMKDFFGNNASSTAVDMRGYGITGGQNTLILLDGRRITDVDLTSVQWAAIPLAGIERIEILRGSGAVLYGGGATGGTIHIITRAPRAGERSASIYGGAASYGTGEAGIGANLAGDGVGLRFNASYLETHNYRDNNALRQGNALADIRWTGNGGTLSLKAGADDQALRLPGALNEAQIAANRRQAATPRDFSDRWGGFFNLGGEFRLGAGEVSANLGYREKNIHASIIGSPIDSDTRAWSFSPRLKLPHRLGGWHHSFVAGLDWDDWQFDNSTTVFGAPRRPSAFQRNGAIYVQNTTALSNDWSLALGARRQQVEYGVADQANPAQTDARQRDLFAHEVAARYRVSAALAAYGKFGTSFRVPNVNDVYNLFTGAVNLLEPQTSHDREIGLDIRSGTAGYRVALYHMDLDNELFFDPQAFVNRNLPPTRRYGVEAEGKWRPAGALDYFANYTYAVSQFRSGSFGGVALAGNDVPLVPRHAFNLGAGWAFAPRARADAVLRYVGAQTFDSDEANTYGRKMPAYTVVDLKLAWDNRGWRVGAGVKNLFDEKYFSYGVFSPAFPPFPADFFAYPAPERSLFVTAQYDFR